MKRSLFIALVCLNSFAQSPELSSYFEGVKEEREFLHITSEYLNLPGLKNVRIAILNDGFEGLLTDRKYLTAGSEVVATYDESSLPPNLDDSSARRLAQFIWAVTGDYNDLTKGPVFKIFNVQAVDKSAETYGQDPSNFQKAYDAAMAWKPDIVLNTKNFEFYGNFEGTGPINRLIEKAVSRGIIWIQTAGRYRGFTYNRAVDFETDIVIPLRVRTDENKIVLALSWNSHSPGKSLKGTLKDLDLILYRNSEDAFNGHDPLASSVRAQVEDDPVDDTQTLIPFEALKAEVGIGEENYAVVVRKRGGDFSPTTDRLRLTLLQERPPYYDEEAKKLVYPVELLNTTDDGSIMVCGDSRFAITVGNLTPESSIGRNKPDVILESRTAVFSDKVPMVGPNLAAAEIVAAAALLKAKEPSFGPEHLRLWIQELKKKSYRIDVPYDLTKTEEENSSPVKNSKRWRMPDATELKAIMKSFAP